MSRAAQTVPSVTKATEQSQQTPPNKDLEKLLQKDHVPVRDGQFVPDSLDGYWRLATMYCRSGMVPKSLEGRNESETIAKLTICMEAGACLGLSITQSVTSIMVVNNRPALWGDALPALIRKSGQCAGIVEWFEGEGDNYTALCTMKRITKLANGQWAEEEQTRSFSVADAKKAGLWGKQGPWQNYGPRMLQVRARAWGGRDVFADVLMGFGVVEELQDIPAEPTNGHADKAASAQAAIEALKPAPTAPESPTQPGASNGKGWSGASTVHGPNTKPQEGQAAAPAGKPDGGDPANHDTEADAGDGQGQDEPRCKDCNETKDRCECPGEFETPNDESQLTQGTDAETSQAPTPGVQAAAAHNPTARRSKPPKGTGHADATPPQSFFDQQEQQAQQPQNVKPPAPARPWHK